MTGRLAGLTVLDWGLAESGDCGTELHGSRNQQAAQQFENPFHGDHFPDLYGQNHLTEAVDCPRNAVIWFLPRQFVEWECQGW